MSLMTNAAIEAMNAPFTIVANTLADHSTPHCLTWITQNRSLIDEQLASVGAVLIRGLTGIQDAATFHEASLVLFDILHDYVGGTSPRTAIHGKVMNATNIPNTWSIILHQEMAYTKNMPGKIAFFCERPAEVLASSTIGDMCAALSQIDPSIVQKANRLGMQLRRVLPDQKIVHKKPGIQKSWQESLSTTQKETATSIAVEKQWKAEWTADNSLVLWQDLVPALRRSSLSGSLAWCNQMHVFSPDCLLRWAQEDQRPADAAALQNAIQSDPELLDNMFYGNGDRVPSDEALHVFAVMRSIEMPVALYAHDILILDNIRFSHGRLPYRGDRKILVTLAD